MTCFGSKAVPSHILTVDVHLRVDFVTQGDTAIDKNNAKLSDDIAGESSRVHNKFNKHLELIVLHAKQKSYVACHNSSDDFACNFHSAFSGVFCFPTSGC